MPRFVTMTLPETQRWSPPMGPTYECSWPWPGAASPTSSCATGMTSRAVRHRTVDEIWYVLGGHGEMWRSQDGDAEVITIEAGTCLTIPVGTSFQFRSFGEEPLTAVAVTMPPWPGDAEAVPVDGNPDWTG